MLIAIQAILGGLMRRWWGGWTTPDNTVKRVVVPLVAVCVGLMQYGPSFSAPVVAAYVTFCFLMPHHGFAAQMGRDPKHPLWACLLVSFAQYGLTAIAMSAILWYGFGKIFLPLGVFYPLILWGAWKVWDWKQYRIGGFIDGPTAIGELYLGATLLGGIYGMA